MGLLATVSVIRAAETASLNLAPNPSFEQDGKRLGGWIPLGVFPEGEEDRVRFSTETALTGQRSLEIRPGPRLENGIAGTQFYADYNGGEGQRRRRSDRGVIGVRTFAMRLDPDVTSVTASVWTRRPVDQDLSLGLEWTTRRDRRPVVHLHRDVTREPTDRRGQWERLSLQAPRPAEAIQVQLRVESHGAEPFHLDEVELTFLRRPTARILVNQMGFAPQSRAKRALLQSTGIIESPEPAQLIRLDDYSRTLTVPWSESTYDPASDYHYRTVDFSELAQEGEYVMSLGSGRTRIESPRFSIRTNLLHATTARMSYRFYYAQRCGTAVPGVHAACHLDDAKLPDGSERNLAGGWHDAGDYNKYNGLTPDAVRRLAEAYHRKPGWFAKWDEDTNGLPDILDEALWGADWLERMMNPSSLALLERVSTGYGYWGAPDQETDNRPGTGDERPVSTQGGDRTHCVAAFAILGHHLSQSSDTAERGRRYLELSQRLFPEVGGDIPTLLSLCQSTREEFWPDRARARAEQLLDASRSESTSHFRELAIFAIERPADSLLSRIFPIATRRVAELNELCDNVFRVAQRRDASGTRIYCRAYEDVNDWYVGETAYRLEAAIDGLLAARLGIAEGRTLAEHQVNWLLGCNPGGVSLMEGVGSKFVSGYHHRYNAIPGNPRGAVEGAILNGFVRAFPHIDRPWLDLCAEPNADYHSNEPWLLQNNRWLEMLSWW